VVAHTCLSGKHTVYLVKAGSRMLVIGTGAQGPPALLGEWAGPVAAELASPAAEQAETMGSVSRIGAEP
jgi:hypothetical protein